MRFPRVVILAASVLALSPALAAGPATSGTGDDDPAAAARQASARHLQIVNEIQAELPASSRAHVQQAIKASMKAQERATAALETQQGKPSVTGLQRARQNIAANLERSTTNLQRVIATVPPQAAEKIQLALARMQEQRAALLANLDRVIAVQEANRIERAAAERPQRAGASETPQRPDHPDHPEHPDRPDRPDQP